MNYQSLYRRWRPQTFAQVIGQDHITTTLTNALRTGRFSHAYLFAGPRGTGKTSTAKILAKALNCQGSQGQHPEPCNQCVSCLEIGTGHSLDVIEIDAASNRGIDEIRDLREKTRFSPASSQYKIYIIDEVHMLTTEAFNALLKTLEEPPGHVVFVLATTDPQKIPLTVLSRCQRFDFHRLSTEQLVIHMTTICQEMNVEGDPVSLYLIGKTAEGGVRDALSLLDQAIAYCGHCLDPEAVAQVLGVAPEESYFRMADMILHHQLADCIFYLDDLLLSGGDIHQFTQGLIWHFRNLLLLLSCGEVGKEQVLSKDQALAQAHRFGLEGLFKIIKQLSSTLGDMKYSSQPRIDFELALVQLIGRSPQQVGKKVAKKKPSSKQEEATSTQNLGKEKESVVSTPPSLLGKGSSSQPAASSRKEVQEEVSKASPNQHLPLEDVQKNWKKILSIVGKERPALVHILKEGRPVGVVGNRLFLGFQVNFYGDMINQQDNRMFISRIVGDVLGTPMQIASEQLPQTEGDRLEEEYLLNIEVDKKKQFETGKEQDNDPVVTGLLTMFSGEVVPDEEQI